MSEELIRKSEVLKAIEEYKKCYTCNAFDDGIQHGLQIVEDELEDMQPVNAVELPCKVGDTVYFVERQSIVKEKVVEIRICKRSSWVETYFGYVRNISEIFCTREEAERALEELKNDK